MGGKDINFNGIQRKSSRRNSMETTASNSIDLHVVPWNSQELDHGIRISHWVTDVNGMYLQFSTDLGVTANYWISSLLLHRKPLNLFGKVMNTN